MKHIAYIAVFMGLLMASSCSERPTDWKPYYESQYKTPYGTHVLSKELENQFPKASTDVIKNKTESYFDGYEGGGEQTYFYINELSYLDSSTLYALLDFTGYSNSIFIATSDEECKVFDLFNITLKQAKTSDYKLTLTALTDGDKAHSIKSRNKNITYFETLPAEARVLGYISVGDSTYPNYISLNVQHGKGNVYLHANPELFSNYHLLHDNDGLYGFNCFSHLVHTDNFIWDGFSTRSRYTADSSSGTMAALLRYIRNNNALYLSFLTIVTGLILLLLFNYKRVTRTMPIHVTQKNNSIAFMKMVANLFENEENHIDLGRYRLTYILDKIRHKFYLDTAVLDDAFKQKLTEKTGLSGQEVSHFVLQLNKIKQSNFLTKEGFITINKNIEPIIKKLSLNE
jgi:hypothetical protein